MCEYECCEILVLSQYSIIPMIKYFNSTLKLTSLIMLLLGGIIIILAAESFSLLGVSVMLLSSVTYFTATILMKSTMNNFSKRIVEMALMFVLLLFFGVMALDFLSVFQLAL